MGAAAPKQLRKLFDILHLLVGTACNHLILPRLRLCGCGVRGPRGLEAFHQPASTSLLAWTFWVSVEASLAR